jgi:hypothetical protein
MMPVLRERCQFENTLYRYVPPLGLARALRRAYRRLPDMLEPRRGEGTPSRYSLGAWVRVKDRDAIRATLDPQDALRGLRFTEPQWEYCGKTYRVDAVVTRLMDDRGRMRPIARTVALDGPTCDGPAQDRGCGRACPLLFRDEWLDPSTPDRAEPVVHAAWARVKPLAEIRATLDRRGRRGGLQFDPAMERYAGMTLPLLKRVAAGERPWRHVAGEWYILAGARCRGDVLGADGPCRRGCAFLWHRDWIEFA